MYCSLLKKLEENTDTNTESNIWNITLASDGSGELVHPSEATLTLFNDLAELTKIVDALINVEKTLTVALCVEVLMEVERNG